MLVNYLILFIKFILIRVVNYWLLNEGFHVLRNNSINNPVQFRVSDSFIISESILDPCFQWLILHENCFWLECIDQLFAKLNALFAIMFTAKNNDHLLSLLILHYDHSVFKVEVHHDIFRWAQLKSLKGLLLNLFTSLDLLEHVEMLLVKFWKLQIIKNAAK